MKKFFIFFLLFIHVMTLRAEPDYTHLLEAPYPPQPVYETTLEDCPPNFDTIDDVADYELGKPESLQRDRQDYHQRLLSSITSTAEFFQLQEIGGYLIPLSKQDKITKSVDEKIKTVFDQSLRRIYYAGYGCDTLEETLHSHEELQSAIAKYYPGGIPLERGRLSQYFKAMAYGYRKNYLDKIEKLRKERLTIIDGSSEEAPETVHPGLNPLKIILDKKTRKPLAIWKAGTDKYFGKFMLMALGKNEKVFDLEKAKLEMGFIATWNELLAEALNYLYRGKFHTPMVARFGNTTLHAYHKNDGSLSRNIHEKKAEIDTFISELDSSNIQYWGMMQFLMTSPDAHFGNTLVDGKHLIAIDFGRALGLPIPVTQFQLRCSSFEFPQMKLPFSPEDRELLEMDLIPWLQEFVGGIEKYEERKVVRPYILKAVNHLGKNLTTLRLAMAYDLSPYQMYRLKYPSIGLEDHFLLEELFKSVNNKDLYGDAVKDFEIRRALSKSEIFKNAPFVKAFILGENDDTLFEYMIDKELQWIYNTPEEDLFTEIQLGWLIRASIIIPIKLKPFF